jgi:hypothetical protein
MRLLDLFCGRWGWSKGFARRGWECYGIDLVRPEVVPDGCVFVQWDVMMLSASTIREYKPDFIVASSPCEQFSVHGMRHFHPNPPYPELGIKLFNHTRELCEASGVPYVMENVRAAQQFVGNAVHHCGPFYLWGSGVPALIHKGIIKGKACYAMPRNIYDSLLHDRKELRRVRMEWLRNAGFDFNAKRKAAEQATIPPELADCVAQYAERILENAPIRQTR